MFYCWLWPALADARLGDLDAMVGRGEIRLLTTFTLSSYYIDRGRQRGGIYEISLRLEDYVGNIYRYYIAYKRALEELELKEEASGAN